MNKQQLRSLIREEIKKMIKENYFMTGQQIVAKLGNKTVTGKITGIGMDEVPVVWEGLKTPIIYSEKQLLSIVYPKKTEDQVVLKQLFDKLEELGAEIK